MDEQFDTCTELLLETLIDHANHLDPMNNEVMFDNWFRFAGYRESISVSNLL
jgi:hypothetical protein